MGVDKCKKYPPSVYLSSFFALLACIYTIFKSRKTIRMFILRRNDIEVYTSPRERVYKQMKLWGRSRPSVPLEFCFNNPWDHWSFKDDKSIWLFCSQCISVIQLPPLILLGHSFGFVPDTRAKNDIIIQSPMDMLMLIAWLDVQLNICSFIHYCLVLSAR